MFVVFVVLLQCMVTKQTHDCIIAAGHLGRDKTVQKVTERFYWKTLWTDIQQYIHHCEVCQHANDSKFQKATAPLHPIPVKSKVWNQVAIVAINMHTTFFTFF